MVSTTIYAQFDANNALYLTGEVNLGNYIGVDLNINYVYKDTYTFKIGYTDNIRDAKSKPKDFNSGLIGVLLFGVGDPDDQFENFQLCVGKLYKLNPRGTIRANMSIGLGYTIIETPENWQRIDNGAGFVGNYLWDYRKHNTISLIINPKIEFPFTRYFGLTLSPMVQINKDTSYFGIGIGTMIGLLRSRIE